MLVIAKVTKQRCSSLGTATFSDQAAWLRCVGQEEGMEVESDIS